MELILSAIVISLSVWRISNMFADINQEGLFNSLDWIRYKVGVRYKDNPGAGTYNIPYGKPGSIASGILCMWCNSIWVGTLFTIFAVCNLKVTTIGSLPFALSAVVIFIEEWRDRNAIKT
jgi:hypothetical protein